MSIRKVKGKTKVEWLPVTTSTALAKGIITEFTSGLIAEADDNDVDLAGVTIKAIVSTDSDYATARRVPILVPIEKGVVWEIDTGGSFVATDVGAEFGISDSGTLDHSDTTNKVFKVTKFISATKVQGYLKVNTGGY